jgi:hypothetical protein
MKPLTEKHFFARKRKTKRTKRATIPWTQRHDGWENTPAGIKFQADMASIKY